MGNGREFHGVGESRDRGQGLRGEELSSGSADLIDRSRIWNAGTSWTCCTPSVL